MKKILISLSLALLATGSALAAVGDTFTIDGVVYKVGQDNTVSVSDVVTSALPSAVTLTAKVTDPATSTEYTLTEIGEEAFYWADCVSVNIPNTVTTLADKAFYSCGSLTSVTFDEGCQVKTIGDYAFGSAKVLPSITIPEGVESIGNSCFFACYKLESISLPSTLKSIGKSCFYKCGLTSVNLPAGLTSLGDKAFLECSKLASITIPAGITELGEAMFNGASSLKSIKFPKGLTKIGDECFLAAGLTGEITLPASLTTLGDGAFAKCPITAFNIEAGNTSFTKVGDVVYSANKTLAYAYPGACANTEVTIDPACVGISGAAFWGSNVTKVTLPEGFRAFDDYSFCQAASLTSINFPSTLVFFGEQAFAGTGLTSVVIPEGVCQLPEAVFAQCTELTDISFPSSLNYIDIRNMWKCSKLTTINCYGSTAPTLETWYESYESPFYNVPSNCKVHVPAGCKSNYSGDWTDAFSTSRIVDDLPGYIAVSTITPAADASVATLSNVAVAYTVEDGATYSVAVAQPAVVLQAGPLAAGVPVGDKVAVDHWTATAAESTMTLTPYDASNKALALNLEKDKTYYLTIPGGVFVDNNGKANERAFIKYEGNYEEPALAPTAISPANDAEIDAFDGVDITFGEDVTVVSSKTSSIKFLKGSIDAEGNVTGTDATSSDFDSWMITGSKASRRIWMADMDYYTCSSTLEADADYYLVIPAGLFKNSAGVENAQIVLHYTKPELKPIVPSAYSPANNAQIDTFEGVDLTFGESVTVVSAKKSDIKFVKGSIDVDGNVTGTDATSSDFDSWMVTGSKTSHRIWMGDMDSYTCSTSLELGANYYLVIPAGLFKNSAGAVNEQIVLHYSKAETKPVVPTAYSPANNTELDAFSGVDLSFSEEVTVVSSKTSSIKFLKGSETGTDATSSDFESWMVTGAKTSQRIWMADMDSYTCTTTFEAGADYYLVIPEGLFKNAKGAVNNEIVLHYYKSEPLPALIPVSFSPANDATIDSFSGVDVAFDEDVTPVSAKLSEVKFIKGSIDAEGNVAGTDATASDFDSWFASSSKRAPRLFMADMDYYSCTTNLEADADYYLVIPAGLFKNSAGSVNERTVLHYTKGSGVNDIDAQLIAIATSANTIVVKAANAKVDVYTAAGINVAATTTTGGQACISGLASGIYLVRAVQGDVVKTVKVRL